MIEGLFASENIVHAGALLYLAGFLFRNQLILRGLIIAGDFVYILYFYFAPDVPLWGGIFWSVMFTVVNLAMIGLIVADTMHFNLTANEKKLFGLLENLTPGEFRRLLGAGKEELAPVPAVITREGEILDKLYFVLEGTMTIEKGGQRWPSESQTFIGEIAFLLARPATATVTLEPGTVYYVWDAEALHRLLRGAPALNTALSAIMNKKLAQKVASAGVLMNTIGLDYQAPKALPRNLLPRPGVKPRTYPTKDTVMMIDPKGSRPEALAKFAEVARHDDGQPVREGVEATEETAAIPTDPKLKQDAGTKVLREGVLHTDQGAKEAIDKLPDRTAKDGKRRNGSR